jgi:thiopeptide-type bacteriocin biosynthesis protein
VDRPEFRSVDAAIIRTAAYPESLVLPPWPDLTQDDVPGWLTWLDQVWALEGVAEVVEVASPGLARRVTGLCENASAFKPRQIRRATEALARYLLRWTGRATPFGLFAGVAPVELAEHASVRWGGRHVAVSRPDAVWLTDLISDLESRPQVLRQLPVVANDLGFVRGRDWVVPCQCSTEGSLSDVSIRQTAAVRMVLQEAQNPITFSDLLAKLSAESPQTPLAIIEGMLTELVNQRVLLTALHPPMTVTDPHAHVVAQLNEIDDVPENLGTGQRPAVDLRLDCSISLPPAVMREAEAAASILVRLAPQRPAWQAYHAAFLERYGPGALVGVRELVDADTGLGYPAGYRGSLRKVAPQLLPRDVTLAELAQRAALDGCTELVLDDRIVTELTTTDAAPAVPHTELRFSLHAPTPRALDAGQFILIVVSASRHAGTSVGRFLYLFEPDDRDRIQRAYSALPMGTPGALAVQLSCPPLSTRIHNLARIPAVLPLVPLGEHRRPSQSALRLDDLAVTADAHRFYVRSLSRGCPVEPLMLNAVDLRHGAHPLARFLCEISTARTNPCTSFFWGHAAQRFPFLPRVRYGRTVLSPARWNIGADGLPGSTASWQAWARSFRERQQAHRIPDLVQLGDDDVRIRLDLTEPAHLTLLRAHLDRTGNVALTEGRAEYGWIGGRPHEIVVPLALKADPQAVPRPRRSQPARPGPGRLPGTSEWFYAKLYGHPGRQADLLTIYLPDLLSAWDSGPPDAWWFIRYDDPEPHLRLRLRLHHPERYGAAVHIFGAWATGVHRDGLLRDFTLDTYHPETGRYGIGTVLRGAESVFAADSAVAVAQMRAGLNAQALVAASYVDIATNFTGSYGLPWLIEHVARGGGPGLDRDALGQARQSPPVPLGLLERRRTTLSEYQAQLDGEDVNAVLADLLHLHHARMIGIDLDSERKCLRLARAVAQELMVRNERIGSSAPMNGSVTPTTR